MSLPPCPRYGVLRQVDSLQKQLKLRGGGAPGLLGAESESHWLARLELALALAFCLLCHLPYFFQFDVVECEEFLLQGGENGTRSDVWNGKLKRKKSFLNCFFYKRGWI